MTTDVVRIGGLPALDKLAFDIGQAPAVAYFWLRDALFKSALAHRNWFVRHTGVKLNRRPSSANPNPIQATRVGEIAGADPDRDILWVVAPPEKRKPSRDPRILDDLAVHIFTNNPVLEGQELGGIVTPKRAGRIAIPIAVPALGVKRGRRSPAAYRKRYPKAVLLAKQSRKSGLLLLFERVRKRTRERKVPLLNKDGSKRARQPKVAVDKLVPRWVLLPSLATEGRLEFFSSWNATAPARENFFAAAARRIVDDIAKGTVN